MSDCINMPDTRLHPTKASEAQFATCNAGAIHTRHLQTTGPPNEKKKLRGLPLCPRLLRNLRATWRRSDIARG